MTGVSREASDQLNLQIVTLYEKGLGCRQIGREMEMLPASIYKRLRRLGLLRNRQAAAHLREAPDPLLPFTQGVRAEHLRNSAVGAAVQWFLDRGYTPSLPVHAAVYDLIVESDEGLKRVQVKTTNMRDPVSGNWSVRIARQIYDPGQRLNAMGRRKRVPYTLDQIDFFFIVTGDQSLYLIPTALTYGACQINLDSKYKTCKVG